MFDNENKVHFWIPHEIVYDIETHIEYPQFAFQIGIIQNSYFQKSAFQKSEK